MILRGAKIPGGCGPLEESETEMMNVSEALCDVNLGRAVLSLAPISKLPLGHRSASRFSPISRALEGPLTVLENKVQCDDEVIVKRLSASWNTPCCGDGEVELPAAIRTFIRLFEDGMLPEFESNLCTVVGCDRNATTVRGDAPLCDHCAEEWESVEPLLAYARREASVQGEQTARRATGRLIFVVANFFRSAASLITFGRFGRPKQNPPMSDKPGPTGSSAAA